jgi:hypothetical protein
MLRVIWELFDPEDFEERKMEREPALEEINPALSSIRALRPDQGQERQSDPKSARLSWSASVLPG